MMDHFSKYIQRENQGTEESYPNNLEDQDEEFDDSQQTNNNNQVVVIDNLNEDISINNNTYGQECDEEDDLNKMVIDYCPRIECIERESIIAQQEEKIKELEAQRDEMMLKLMSKKGKIALLKL